MNPQRLVQAVRPYSSVAVIAHNNPDPDAMASAWAVRELLACCAGCTPRLITGGGITRAENREFHRLLHPPLEFIDGYAPDPDTFLIFVDCQPDTRNHPARQPHPPDQMGVIDHHGDRTGKRIAFVDIREKVVATASIACSYLQKMDVPPSKNLATGLMYAIRSEASGGETFYSQLDRRMLNWLTPMANPETLARIEQAPLPLAYYQDLVLAMQAAELVEDTAFCELPRLPGPDFVGEVSDLLIRCESVKRVLCVGAFKGRLFLSVRTLPRGGNAAELVAQTIGQMGASGGHLRRAGGAIEDGSRPLNEVAQLVRHNWFGIFHKDKPTRRFIEPGIQ